MTDISSTARYLWERGWAERNAGNFSVNVTRYFTARETERFSEYPFDPLPREYPLLAGHLLLVSGTGCRMRDLAVNPPLHTCFVYISGSGAAYHIISENQEGIPVLPTSELATHLAVQHMLLHSKAGESVVLHAHVTDLIALTHLPQFRSADAINRMLAKVHPEIGLFLPEGAGYIPFTTPGTENMASATLKGFGSHKAVIWERHGAMAIGRNLPEAFDHLDLLAKAAGIWFRCRSAGMEITPDPEEN
ncbi:MAG TPA: rhamnulose-1-phosphate aldolase, partial [Bacteroidales bacterium]|nr:rhamnulose-1-phosphate aldolase [Bacteroidales bacterium]